MPGDVSDADAAFVKVGGLVDEVSVTLAVFGEDLDPDHLSQTLGCRPTRFGTKGDTISRSRPDRRRRGFWLLEVKGSAPVAPDQLVENLLAMLPSEAAFWLDFTSRYETQIKFGIHVRDWNRGFVLSKENVSRLCQLHVPVDFDIYAYPEEDA